MEIIILTIVFSMIMAFCFALWKLAVNEEKKEIKKLFH